MNRRWPISRFLRPRPSRWRICTSRCCKVCVRRGGPAGGLAALRSASVCATRCAKAVCTPEWFCNSPASAFPGARNGYTTPAGVVYPFLAPGKALAGLLQNHSGVHTAFAQRVAQTLALRNAASPPAGPPRRTQTLQHREVQILHLLGLGLRNREIGQRLFISEETVKWYLKKIYETLQVGNRTHALVRAREL